MANSATKSQAKARTAYVCAECGADHNKWQGQCAECEAWNSLSEFVIEPASAAKGAAASRRSSWAGKIDAPQVTALKDVRHDESARVSTGIGELDRVLGGGLVPGAVVLVGGDPGIGKSTLLLQAVTKMAATLPSLYVTGEESLAQVAGRASRLGLPLDGVHALAETGVEKILESAIAMQPKLIVADSVQTLWTEQLSAAPGSVSQVRESAARLAAVCEGNRYRGVPGRPRDQGRRHRRPARARAHGRRRAVFRRRKRQPFPRAARIQEPFWRGE
jgi:DNA repair protein RadA/Sms